MGITGIHSHNHASQYVVLAAAIFVAVCSTPGIAFAEQELTVIDAPDELTAVYFAAVADNLAEPLAFLPEAISGDILDSWEAEFGDDKRYWELRYHCCRLSRGFSSGVDVQPEDFLLKARDLNLADWEADMVLLPDELKLLREDSQARIESLEFLRDSEQWLQAIGAIHAEREGRELGLYSHIVDKAPDQAWPLWERGRYYLGLGELELALADITAGNSASNYTIPRLYPESLVLDSIAQGNLILDPAVHGAVLGSVDTIAHLPQAFLRKEETKNMLAAVRLGADPVLLSAFYTMICRMSQADRTLLIEVLWNLELLEILLADQLTEQAVLLSSDQRRLLLSAYRELLSVRPLLRSHQILWQEWHPLQDSGSARLIHYDRLSHRPDRSNEFIEQLLADDDPAVNYALSCQLAASEETLLRERIAPIFDKLGQLDLAELEIPADWSIPFV